MEDIIMVKEDIKKKLSQAESTPSSYTSLDSVATGIRILAIIVAVVGGIIGLTAFKTSAVVALTSLIEVAISAGLIYAVSVIISGIANIVLNTHTTKRLLELQIKLDNDIE